MRIHIVNPYESAAMTRLVEPFKELARLYDVTTSKEALPDVDVNIHIPFHTLSGETFPPTKHVIAYTHCNPGALPELLTACNRADIITAMSFTGRQELLNFGVDPKKIWVVPCAADGFTYRPRRVLVVGFPQPNGRKRESILLDLAFQYNLTAFEFWLAGAGWEELGAKLASLGVKGKIVVTVDDNTLSEFYKSADVFLATGYLEGGPLPLLEAMASGCKVLSPKFGYASDYLSEDELYSDAAELMEQLNFIAWQSLHNHQIVRTWSWRDYAAEYALLIGRLLGESVDLYPERGASRYAQLLDVIDEIKPHSICEIGTWNGNRAIQMLQQAGKYHQSKRLHYQGFDLFESQTGEQYTRELSKLGQPENVVYKRIAATGARIKLIAGDTVDTIDNMPCFDFYFVDGGHSEETIRNDGERVVSYLDEYGGTAVFDDYYHEGKPDGVGCNAFIDNLDTNKYEITHLPIRTQASDGRLIGMVKVRRNANVHLQRRDTQARGNTWYDKSTYSYLCGVSKEDAPSTASGSGELGRITSAPSGRPPA